MKRMSPNQIANFFGVSVETLKQQYLANAKVLDQMRKKAIRTGKKVNGYTVEQLEKMTADYYIKSI